MTGGSAATLADFLHPEDPGWTEPPEDMDAEAWEPFVEDRTYPVAFVARSSAPVGHVARLRWDELAEMLSSPGVGQKDGAGWMPADIEPGPRKGERVHSVSLLVLDVEAETQGRGEDKRVIGLEPPPFEAMRSEICARRWRALLHTSYSHSPDHPRYRIVLDVSRPLEAHEVRPVGEHVALLLGIRDACDLKCIEPARLFYLPRMPDAEINTFLFADVDGAALDVDALLTDIAAVLRGQEVAALRAAGPVDADADDVIGAFNRRWSPVEFIERNGYKRSGQRWLFNGSSTGLPGVVLLPDSEPQRVFSHHAGDPLATGHACSAFDCLMLLEHGGDMRAAVRAAADALGLSRRNDRERVDPETGEVLSAARGGDGEDRAEIWNGVEPVNLWAQFEAPALPADLLPDTIKRFAVKHGEVMGVDPAGLALAALAVCAATITDEIAVQVKRNDPSWRESARLWVGLVGVPSVKKTPIMSAALRPLRRIDANLMRTYTEKRNAYEELSAKERKAADRPPQERRIIADTTVEAAQEVLKDSHRGVLSAQDELSGWFGQMDKYAPGKGSMADRAFYLQAFNGGSYSINRVQRGAFFIPNCSISLLGGIQPEPLRAIANDMHDDGLIQRLLPILLRTGRAGRDVPADGAVTDYERLIERLELMRPPMRRAIADDDDRPQPLRFDDRARAIREELEEKHLGLMHALEGVSPKLASHFGKYDGLFARLCVLWHCIEHANSLQPPVEIGLPVAERVAAFMERFLRPMAVAFYSGVLGLSAGHDDLMALASHIVAKGVQEVKAREVQSAGQSFRHWTADQVRVLCEKLEAFGWLARGEPGPKSNTPRWLVNPAVHQMFAEQARKEAARRESAREALRQALEG